MSSLAAFVARPGTAAYCASKAAVRIWGEGLRERLAPQGVGRERRSAPASSTRH